MRVIGRAAAVAGVVLAVVLAAGCGTTAAPAPAAPTTTPPTSAPLPDPVTACTTQITYWAGEMLRGAEIQGDFQHMGLVASQYDALRAIVARARVDGPAQVPAAAREACVRITAEPPSSSPWG